jgi:hypothetical protein
MSTFGVTSLIAQGLEIKLASDLSSELSQFSRDENEPFSNRKAVSGLFSQQALTSMKNSLAKYRLKESEVINGVLANVDVGLKLKASGGGLFGLLSKTSLDAMAGVGLMEEIRRKRMPRAFLNNRIDRFDPMISEAQLFIQKTKPAERIRMTGRVNDKILCCTNQYLFLLDKDLTSVLQMINITDIELGVFEHRVLEIVVRVRGKKETILVTCEDQGQMDAMRVYLMSQLIMIKFFNRSMI